MPRQGTANLFRLFLERRVPQKTDAKQRRVLNSEFQTQKIRNSKAQKSENRIKKDRNNKAKGREQISLSFVPTWILLEDISWH
jgi:hypothetical protein